MHKKKKELERERREKSPRLGLTLEKEEQMSSSKHLKKRMRKPKCLGREKKTNKETNTKTFVGRSYCT